MDKDKREKIPFDLTDYPDSESKEEETPAPEQEHIPEDVSQFESAEPPVNDIDDGEADISLDDGPLRKAATYVKRLELAIILLALFGVFYLAYSVNGFISDAFARGAAWGWISLFILAGLAAFLGLFAFGEIIAYMRLRSFDRLREAVRLLDEDPHSPTRRESAGDEFRRYVDRMEETLEGPLQDGLQHVRGEMEISDDPCEWVWRAEESLMKRMDRQADSCIKREAVYVAVGTMVSPYGFLDGGILFWRAARLVTDIGRTYNVRAGRIGGLRLVVRTLAATVGSMITHEVSTALFVELMRDLPIPGVRGIAPHLSQGAMNALMIIWVGREARRRCRPLPAREDIESEKSWVRSMFKEVRRRIVGRGDVSEAPEPA